MNLVMGCFLLTATTFLFFKYRPRSRESKEICLISVAMGIMSLILTDGVLILQLAEGMMQVSVFLCCFFRLRGERKYLERKKRRLRCIHQGDFPQRCRNHRAALEKACA